MRPFEELKVWIGNFDTLTEGEDTGIEISDKDYDSICKLVKQYKVSENEDCDIDWEWFGEYIQEQNPKLFDRIDKKVRKFVADVEDGCEIVDNIDDYEFGEDYGFYVDGDMFEE